MNRSEYRNYRALLILIVLVPLLALSVEKCMALPVEYNPSGSPVPTMEMQEAIKYAVWVWTSRLDIDSEYIGQTGNTEPQNTIIIQWESFPFFNEDRSLNTTLGSANWWNTIPDNVLRRASIRLNSNWFWGKTVDACLLELLVHEIGHVFSNEGGHTDDPRDVMFKDRGECRYTPSVNDLALIGKPVKSCDVELTPDGALEYLDYKGQRIQLLPVLPRVWEFGAVYPNASPSNCNAVSVKNGIVTARVSSFNQPTTIMTLVPVYGRYVRISP